MSELPKVKQDRLFNIIRLVDSGPDRGRLEIFTSAFGTKLGSITLEEVSGWVSGSVIKLASFPKTVTGLANGTAAIARLVDSDGNIVRDDLSVGVEDSGADIIVESLTFATSVAQKVVEGQIALDTLRDVKTDKSGRSKIVSVTRPANTTPYTTGDVVGNATSGNIEIPYLGSPNSEVIILAVDLIILLGSLPSGMTAGFNAHFFKSSPAAIADNAAFTLVGNEASYQAEIPLVLPAVKAGRVRSMNNNINVPVMLDANGSGWLNLETLSGFTPASGEEYQLNIHVTDL